MSNTDKTKPMHLRALMRPEWTEEYHDHRNGRECDLPPRPTAENLGIFVLPRGITDNCGWVVSQAFWGSGLSHCCCSTCRRHREWEGGVKDPHAQRREGRRYARASWRDEF